jgi:hypothetical protein
MWFASRCHPQPTDRNRARARRFVPQLEGLENRTLPSTLTVLNALDCGAGPVRDRGDFKELLVELEAKKK